jgi:hypothetical protein
VEVEPFGFTSNGGGGAALLRLIKRREATFYEVINFGLDIFTVHNLFNLLRRMMI